ncbi:MAG: hypothetical protein FWF57_06970 [Defluviitaleaceae bacterium]|nr:hypothetical protein [Defluviitaleaceae bacterium]
MKKFGFFVFVPMFLMACSRIQNISADNENIKIAHSGGFLPAVMYAAIDNGIKIPMDVYNISNSSDIAFSLLSGYLDAGFLDAETIRYFQNLNGFDDLRILGKITYPYGSTLVLRAGLDRRVSELSGLVIAAKDPNCALLSTFKTDAERFNIDLTDVEFIYMPEYTFLSALEAGIVDAAIIQGAYTTIALGEGHTVLYQSWDVEATDDCCPATVAHAALILFARNDSIDNVMPFVNYLYTTNRFSSPDTLRHAVANNTVIPFENMVGQPMPSFALADDNFLHVIVN